MPRVSPGPPKDQLWGILHQQDDPAGAAAPPRLSRQGHSVPDRIGELPALDNREPHRLPAPAPIKPAPQWAAPEVGDLQRPHTVLSWTTRFENDRRMEMCAQRMEELGAAAMEGRQQQHRQTSALAAQCQRLDMRVQELAQAAAAASLKVDGLSSMVNSVVASKAAGDSAAGAASSAWQHDVAQLRSQLERESTRREELGAEIAGKLRDLTGAMQRQQAQRVTAEAAASVAAVQHGVAAGNDHRLEALRMEVDALQSQVDRVTRESARRYADIEASCAQQILSVKESATASSKELLEGQQALLEDCKASVASLQQGVLAKDSQLERRFDEWAAQKEDASAKELAQLTHSVRQGHTALEALGRRVALLEEATAGAEATRKELRNEVELLRVDLSAMSTPQSAARGALRSGGAGEALRADAMLIPHGGGAFEEELRAAERRLQQQISATREALEQTIARGEAALQEEMRSSVAEAASKASSAAASGAEAAAEARAQELRQRAESDRRSFRDELEQRLSEAGETHRWALAEVRAELQDARASAQAYTDRAKQEAQDGANAALRTGLEALRQQGEQVVATSLKDKMEELRCREDGLHQRCLSEVSAVEARLLGQVGQLVSKLSQQPPQLPEQPLQQPPQQPPQQDGRQVPSQHRWRLESFLHAGALPAVGQSDGFLACGLGLRVEELERRLRQEEQQTRAAQEKMRAFLESKLGGLMRIQTQFGEEVSELWQAHHNASKDHKASLASLRQLLDGPQLQQQQQPKQASPRPPTQPAALPRASGRPARLVPGAQEHAGSQGPSG